jgi:hypothetical protein
MDNRQQKIDAQVAQMHAEIAARIRAGDDYPINRALQNLSRWRQQFGGSLPVAYREWQELLEREDIESVIYILLGSDEESIRRRSNSPFTGILSAAERRELMRRAA